MTPVRIGLVIGTDSEYGRRVLRGISKFARETGRRWLFSLTPHREPDLRSLAAWQPAGIIAHLLTRRQAYQVMALGKPVVNVAFLFKDPELPHVGNDDVGIARAAAEHFLERHFRRFAFIGWPGLRFSDLREAGFVAAVQEAGHECVCYRDDSRTKPRPLTGSPTTHEQVREWLAGLATPVAIMACNDIRAWQVLQACLELGRHVPEEIAVVGADNDEAWCLLAYPPLSSVAVAAEQVGFLAAEKLAQLLSGRKPQLRTAVPPLGVVVRQSSDTLMIGDPLVAEAVRFIREHTDRPMAIPDVLAAVPVSRRALERAFRQTLGHSPAAEIRQAHLRRARDLLAATELPMSELARLSGFTGAKQLSIVFRKHLEMTPTEYRLQFRAK